MFPEDSIFCAYKRSPNLKNLMVRANPYLIKPPSLLYKTIDQDPGRSDCKKRCDSCKNLVDHVSSFECLATKNIFKIRQYLTCITPYMI